MKLSDAATGEASRRLTGSVRGILTTEILAKVLVIHEAEASRSAKLELINADVNVVANGVTWSIDVVSTFIGVCWCLYCLSELIGHAWIVGIVFLTCESASLLWSLRSTNNMDSIVSWVLARKMEKRLTFSEKEWNTSKNNRVGKTTKVASQIRALKMLGLRPAMHSYIQSLRATELNDFKTFRSWQSLAMSTGDLFPRYNQSKTIH